MRLTIMRSVMEPDRHEITIIEATDLEPDVEDRSVLHLLPAHRPPTREHCENGVRPCPYVSCRYNLYLDVRGDGVLRVNFPDREPDEMLASCALDMSEDGPRTLDQVAGLMGMSKERARQIEAVAMEKMKAAMSGRRYDDLDE